MASSKLSSSQGLTHTADMAIDDDGYYQVILGRYGGLGADPKRIYCITPDVFNSVKERTHQSALFGEFGSPEVDPDWCETKRNHEIVKIDSNKIGCKLKDIQLKVEGNLHIVTGKMKPFGNYAQGLQHIIDQGIETIVFGHRAVTQRIGTGIVEIVQIVTWDIVKIKGRLLK